MEKYQYYGLILPESSRDKLIDILADYHWISTMNYDAKKVYIHHCTLLHISQEGSYPDIKERLDSMINEGNISHPIVIDGIGISNKAYAFRVKLLMSDTICANTLPHITICTFGDGKPVDSNKIIRWEDIEPITILTELKKV